MSPVAYVVLALLVIGLIRGVAAFKKTRIEAWRRFARERRLEFDKGSEGGLPQLRGNWDGVPVSLRVEYVHRGDNRKAATRATGSIRAALPRGLSVSAEGLVDHVAKFLGAQDIQVGIPEVDRRLRIRAEDQTGARALFQNWRFRQAAVTFVLCGRGATLSQHQATVAREGFLTQPGDLAGLLDLVARCVREVEAALAEPAGDEAPSPAAAGPAARPVSPPGTAVVAVPAPPSPVPQPRPVPVRVAVDPPLASPVLPAVLPPKPPVLAPRPAAPAPAVAPHAPAGPASAPSARPPAAPARPAAPAPPSLDPVTALDRLVRLGDRSLGASERTALIAELRGQPFPLRLEVERVALSQGPDLPADLADGHTVIGKPAGQPGPRLVVRFPPSADAQVSALSWGDHVVATARLAGWDEFYRQAVLDAAIDM